ncbi:hypothetical protein ACEWY4_020606 [Coilia grayii]|uniref:Uncharacterized protein n=1 Tax=Coilia grayii TaxID=363190 RepID=A0ABD1JA27_9TELE
MQILIVVLCVCSPPSPNPNFVVTQKRPPKERETENQVADGGKGMKEREVEGEEDGLEDNKKGASVCFCGCIRHSCGPLSAHSWVILQGPEVTISVSCNAAAQQLEQLEPSTGYSMTITSHQGDRNSVWATTAFTTTGGRGGDGPKDLTASQVTPRSPVLTWKPPSSKVSGYKLQYAIEGQAFQAQTDLRKHKLLRLTPGSKYLVRLQSDMGGVYTEAITIEFTTGDLRFPFPSDCSQELLNGVQESGLVEIFPLGQASVPVSVYCDMETDRGGWTVFQSKWQGDSMTYHNGRHFSTRDRDRSDIRFCAMFYRGGWWYRNCHEANLNGLYNTAHNQEGIIWKTWKGKKYSIPFVEMKMRPISFRPPSLG